MDNIIESIFFFERDPYIARFIIVGILIIIFNIAAIYYKIKDKKDEK